VVAVSVGVHRKFLACLDISQCFELVIRITLDVRLLAFCRVIEVPGHGQTMKVFGAAESAIFPDRKVVLEPTKLLGFRQIIPFDPPHLVHIFGEERCSLLDFLYRENSYSMDLRWLESCI